MNKSVLLTGGTSMIGRHTIEVLEAKGYKVFAPTKEELNLLDDTNVRLYLSDMYNKYKMYNPEYCIHLAGWNGSIAWNNKYPYTIFDRTITMMLNLTRHLPKETKLVSAISSCAYPDFGEEAMQGSLWLGPSNRSVECHGHAKRIFDTINHCLNKQFGSMSVSCVINNSFGPFDSFHPEKTKVVGSLIRKFVEAKQNDLNEVVCWGTGKPLREFIYCKDVAVGLVKAMEVYENTDVPVNITSGQEVSIKGLTELIAKTVGYTGNIVWDLTKPDGQMRKKLQRSDLNFPITPFERALKETVEWYKENKEWADSRISQV